MTCFPFMFARPAFLNALYTMSFNSQASPTVFP